MSAHQIMISLPAELARYVGSAPDASSLIAEALRLYREHASAREPGSADAPASPQVLADSVRAGTGSWDGEIGQLEVQIDELYGEIRDLVALSAEQPAVQTRIDQKRGQLRALQQREADLLEQRAEARLRFNPEEGRRLLERAAKLLQR